MSMPARALFTLAAIALSSIVNAQTTCAELLAVTQPDLRVIGATAIDPAPAWRTPPAATSEQPVEVRVPFCRVEGIIEKEIVFELWLPAHPTWNRRFLGVGNGGDAGFINYQDLARGVQRGFATSSTDTGHKRTDARWALGKPDRVENFGHRAQHLLAVHTKELIKRYYGSTHRNAYFIGCSGGGAQGLITAQRYPNDYDGIISGAGGVGMLPLSARILATALFQEKHPEYALSREQWTRVFESTLAACDKIDGVTDGVVNDPATCQFDPGVLQCSATPSTDCLSVAQVKTVRDAYAPLRDESGVQLDPGFPPGAQYQPVPRQIGIAGLLFGDWTYQNENWNVREFSLARDVPPARDKFWFLMFPQPDLHAFQRSGGKLITYHGWMDEIVPPGLTIGLHGSVVNSVGKDTQKSFRLFMAPGMAHCRRGNGPDSFGQAFAGDPPIVDAEHDMLSALMRWVENGKAPEKIVASRVVNDQVAVTRPLCPYPQRAQYQGKGDVNDAKNFTCSVIER